MHRHALALLLAFASPAAWAGPYRTLPRLPPSQVRARAVAAGAAEKVLARDASAPTSEPAVAPIPIVTATAIEISTQTATPTPTEIPTGKPTLTAIPTPTEVPIAKPILTPAEVPIAKPILTPADAGVMVMPSPRPTRPGEGPLVIEVAATYDEPSSAKDPGPVAGAVTPEAASPAAEGTSPPTAVTASPPPIVQFATICESRQPDGRTFQVVRDPSGALIEILRDAQGRLVSARDAAQ